MDKRLVFLAAVLLLVSFSAGIFTEILSTEQLTLQEPKGQMPALMADYLKSDLLALLAAIIGGLSVFLLPLVPAMVLYKTFSLGFSAAYLLSAPGDNGLSILLAALLPRACFKLPAYCVLTVLSFRCARSIKGCRRSPATWKGQAFLHLRRFFLCFLALALSSLLESVILQAVL